MPQKHYKQVKSPQKWRKKSVRHTPRRSEQKTARTIKKKVRTTWSRTWLRRLVVVGVFGFFAAIIIGSITVAWFSRDLPEPGGLIERDVALSTKIYDRTGNTLLYEVFSDEQRTTVNLEDLPRHVVWASIVAEDRAFYSHAGFKFTSIVRSVLVNVLRGGKAQGGSTITQQLIKNALLTTEKSYTRKIKELILAWQIERKFTKDEILELYFNEIPYGSTAYGIEAASQGYFGKSAHELSIAEAAALAALPQAPSYYSPYGPNKDALIARQRGIINSMSSEGYISPDEASVALDEELKFVPFNTSITAPHFVFFVRDILSRTYGERALEQGGLKVITTLDLYKQDIAQAIIDERGTINAGNFNASNAAFIAMDPKNGEILSMIGSRDFFNESIDGEVNVTTRARQPGSSFKPIVFAAAFEQGLSPDTVLFDLETTFKTDTRDYEPKNYNLDENGPVTIRNALGSSLNIPAVKAIYLAGVSNVIDFAERLGYTTLEDRSRFGLSLVLGGAEVRLIEHAAAYSAFAREGLYHEPVAILKIEDKDGRVLFEYEPDKLPEKRVMEPRVARQINSILSDNSARLLTFNENNYLTLGERPIAAKTGTTNDFRDAWTLGYTPSLVAGVWVGNNDNSTMRGRAAGGTLAAPIWNSFMRQVLGDTPIEHFNAPEDAPLPNKPMFNGSHALEKRVKIDSASGNLATDYTPRTNIIEKTYMEVHNILHYTNQHNLLGPIPEQPWDDPNYTSWELPVEEWASENNITIGTPPTSFDDVHRAEDQPTILLHSPQHGSFSQLIIPTSISVSAPRGLQRIEYFLDNTLIGKELISGDTSISNYSKTLTIPNQFSNGEHLLKVLAYDNLQNDTEVISTIELSIPNNPIVDDVVNFSSPKNNATISSDTFPLSVSTALSNTDHISKVDFYLQNTSNNSTEQVFSTSEIKNEIQFMVNVAPAPGTYSLYAITTNSEGRLNLDNNIQLDIK